MILSTDDHLLIMACN